jgi:alpha,alpha-trehalase
MPAGVLAEGDVAIDQWRFDGAWRTVPLSAWIPLRRRRLLHYASLVRNLALLRRLSARRLTALFCLCAAAALPQRAEQNDLALLKTFSANIARLAPQTVQPATAHISRDYLTPAGYYKDSLWDWDSYFIGAHWAAQNAADAKYLKWWVLNFTSLVDADGFVAGCYTREKPCPETKPVLGTFAVKPFLAQGAYLASERLRDYTWIAPVWPALERVAAYRDRLHFDPKWGLYFWESAMQSGADDNVALTNDPRDRYAILAVDASVYVLREEFAMAAIAEQLRHHEAAQRYYEQAEALKSAILKNIWSSEDAMFWNRRRDTGAWIRRISWSNFVPLAQGLLSQPQGQRMIREHLLNPREMRAPYGFRSLAGTDPDYNNKPTINPYSNWQGPVWINANYLDWMALRRYGFRQEARWTAVTLAQALERDIAANGSMHEDYDGDTGLGLAPTAADSP